MLWNFLGREKQCGGLTLPSGGVVTLVVIYFFLNGKAKAFTIKLRIILPGCTYILFQPLLSHVIPSFSSLYSPADSDTFSAVSR